MTQSKNVTDREVTFHFDEIIVSKTDLKGRMTYCNDVFLNIAGYTEEECLGEPHSQIRHPDMPRSVFWLLWDTLAKEEEIFAYVKNRTKAGDYYWVLAHVTPSYDMNGTLSGYHSNRRVPDKTVISKTIIPLYTELLAAENQAANRKDGMQAGVAHLMSVLEKANVGYTEFISRLAFAA